MTELFCNADSFPCCTVPCYKNQQGVKWIQLVRNDQCFFCHRGSSQGSSGGFTIQLGVWVHSVQNISLPWLFSLIIIFLMKNITF